MKEIKKVTLLLVDDDEVDREMIKKSLTILDAEIDEAMSCADFLRAVSKKKYDLILLDFKLPDGTGIEMARKIKADNITTPIILITDSDEISKESLEAGILGYISNAKDKVTPEIIIKIILGAFAQHRDGLEKLKEMESVERSVALERLTDINDMLKKRIEAYK